MVKENKKNRTNYETKEKERWGKNVQKKCKTI